MDYPIETLSGKKIPRLLREIPDSPRRLYIRGRFPDERKKFLSVVGSRKYSSYGRDSCEKLILGLSGYDVVIVSGLALGIDTLVHRSALTAGLETVAFPGSGLSWDVMYPRENLRLAREILDSGGALVSESRDSFRATPWSFPVRNRLMAGVSHATLIVEAALPSGTLITARLAAEYNRDVCVVPGSIFSPSSEGSHMLMKLGAAPVTRSEDILAVLGLESDNATGASVVSRAFREKALKSCSKAEKKVFDILNVPRPRGDIITASGLNVTDAIIAISSLEIRGLVEELGSFFRRKI